MADDTLEITVPFQNCSSDPPAGSTGYDFKVLSNDQQKQLNDRKVRILRENQLYLKAHPEVTALVSLLLKAALVCKPRKIHEFLATFTKRPQLRYAVHALVEKQKRLCTKKSSLPEVSPLQAGRPPLSLANIVFPSSLKLEDYQVEEAEQVLTEPNITGKAIIADILTLVDEKIKQKEDVKFIMELLESIVKDLKPTMYPPCEPKLYTHTISEKERQAKEPTDVVEYIKNQILAMVEEGITKREDIQYITSLLNSILPGPKDKGTQTHGEE